MSSELISRPSTSKMQARTGGKVADMADVRPSIKLTLKLVCHPETHLETRPKPTLIAKVSTSSLTSLRVSDNALPTKLGPSSGRRVRACPGLSVPYLRTHTLDPVSFKGKFLG